MLVSYIRKSHRLILLLLLTTSSYLNLSRLHPPPPLVVLPPFLIPVGAGPHGVISGPQGPRVSHHSLAPCMASRHGLIIDCLGSVILNRTVAHSTDHSCRLHRSAMIPVFFFLLLYGPSVFLYLCRSICVLSLSLFLSFSLRLLLSLRVLLSCVLKRPQLKNPLTAAVLCAGTLRPAAYSHSPAN